MKKTLIACAFAIFAAGGPGLAQTYYGVSGPERVSLRDAVGQTLYDVRDQKIGIIRGVTNETGQPCAIIATMKSGDGNSNVLVQANELQPRGQGGWLSVLPAETILDLPVYVPGRMLPPN